MRIDADRANGVCANCGSVDLKIKSGIPRCGDAVRELKSRARTKRAYTHRGPKNRGGMTVAQLRKHIRSQADSCDICNSDQQLSVDHDHSCCPAASLCLDCIRGVLCHTCNGLIGSARDDVGILSNAIAYLNKKS